MRKNQEGEMREIQTKIRNIMYRAKEINGGNRSQGNKGLMEEI